MLSSVNSFLGFDHGCIPNRTCLVIGQNTENGYFLLHQAVSASLKEQRPVCLFSFVQKFHHYNAVSQKIGVSLQTSLKSGQFQFIDGLEKLSQAFFPEVSNPGADPTKFLDVLREDLLTSLSTLKENTQTEPVLVIDELSVLLSMGFRVNDIKVFMKSIHQEVLGLTSSDGMCQKHKGTSMVVLCSYSEEDKDSVGLWKFLKANCSLYVNVTGLQTGYCKDVHGQACVTWRESEDASRQSFSKTLQFKLAENGVEFFAAGTSSAVL